VIPLDEHGGSRYRTSLRQPVCKVASAIVTSRRPVNLGRVGPHPKVSDVQYPIEANAQGGFESLDVIVEAHHGPVSVASRTDEHAPTPGRPAAPPPIKVIVLVRIYIV